MMDQRILLEKAEKEDFDEIYRLMEQSFIREEIRDYEDALAVMDEPAYRLYHLRLDGRRIGFVSLWCLGEISFVEHFAIREEYRNHGYGGLVIDTVVQTFAPVVLEAETPETEIAKRRIGFYERHGFVCNPIPYRQPSYRAGGEGVPLVLMSSGGALEFPDRVVSLLYRHVYGLADGEREE